MSQHSICDTLLTLIEQRDTWETKHLSQGGVISLFDKCFFMPKTLKQALRDEAKEEFLLMIKKHYTNMINKIKSILVDADMAQKYWFVRLARKLVTV